MLPQNFGSKHTCTVMLGAVHVKSVARCMAEFGYYEQHFMRHVSVTEDAAACYALAHLVHIQSGMHQF